MTKEFRVVRASAKEAPVHIEVPVVGVAGIQDVDEDHRPENGLVRGVGRSDVIRVKKDG